MRKLIILAVLAAVSAAPEIFAASNAGTSGGQFLKIGVGAQSAALGEASSVLTGAQSIFANPAGMARIAGSEVFFSQVSWSRINV